MNVESAEAALAYTYAWWLTGSEQAARAAVLAAVDRPDVPGADPELRLEILLRRVRAAAVTAPTMCPASELALLHDAIGLGLDSAAGLALIDAREARTELAHGRLEALGPDAEFQITEPQRLGGLAVGNPADVAAARQNTELAQLRAAILQGRDELVDLSRIDIPIDLLDAIAQRHGVPQVEVMDMPDGWFDDVDDVDDENEPDPQDEDESGGAETEPTAAQEHHSGRVTTTPGSDQRAMADLGQSEEIDLSARVGEAEPRIGTSRTLRRVAWTVLIFVVVGGSIALLTQGGGDSEGDPQVLTDPSDLADGEDAIPAEDVVDEQSDAPASDPAPTPTAEPTEEPPTPEPTVQAFVVQRAGVSVGIGGDPDFDNPVAGPFDPVSITVEYVGAEDGDALIADWTVDGQPFDTERADLSPLLQTARFTKQVPEEGWPAGQHNLDLVLERTGEVVGQATFQVTGG